MISSGGAPAEIEQARHDVVDGAEDDEAEEAVDPEEDVALAEHGEAEQFVGAADGEDLLGDAGHDEERPRRATRKGKTTPP